MPSVPVQIVACIQDGGWSCDVNTCNLVPRAFPFDVGKSPGNEVVTHAQSQVPVVSPFSDVLVWIGENDTKTLVSMKTFCFVIVAMKTDTFKNAAV